MGEGLNVVMFGQKRLTREGGVEIVVKKEELTAARPFFSIVGTYFWVIPPYSISSTLSRKKVLQQLALLFLQLSTVLLENMMLYIFTLKALLFSRGCRRCSEKEL